MNLWKRMFETQLTPAELNASATFRQMFSKSHLRGTCLAAGKVDRIVVRVSYGETMPSRLMYFAVNKSTLAQQATHLDVR